jgi:hypothetical protein
MSKPYTVQPGDTLTRIAAREQYPSWRDIYYHPDNAAFRVKRPDPDRIFPGDVLMLPNKARGVGHTPDGTNFALFLMKDPENSRLAKVIIGATDTDERDAVTYRLQPRSFAEAMARKVGPRLVRGLDFQTPEPVTTRSFSGTMLLVQLLNTGAAAMSRLNFTASRKNGSQIPLSFEFGTDASATELTVGPGAMVLDATDRAQARDLVIRRMTKGAV